MKKIALALLCLSLSLPAFAQEPLKVVASFSILEDIVKNVGGDDVTVSAIVGPDADAHAFEVTPKEAKMLADADIVFINGLGFEGWMERLAESSGFKGKLVTVSKDVATLDAEEHHGEEHGHHEHHAHGASDPHAWQDVANVRIYTGNITTALTSARPETAQAFVDRAAAYDLQLQKLDAEIRNRLTKIPAEKRKILTSHDAFGYFSKAYGVAILAPHGLSTHDEPSAETMAELTDQIKREGIGTAFIENISDPKTLKRLSEDTGVKIGGTLYADALSKADGPAPTYLDMMRHNLSLMAKAMEEE